ncbi:MAG: hypothetical protein AB9891_05820 [Anaerolineaceae bacterium]
MQTSIFDLISADGPFEEYSEKMMLYGQFVGSWDIDATWHQPDGISHTAKGEWHFDWVLGGRGVQDVLFAKGSPLDHFGTTLRCYDPTLDVWHITWMQPFGGEFVHLTGRQVGDRIVNEGSGTEAGRLERWSFTEITPRTFLWLGEASFDAGQTWFLEQEMHANRV